MEQHFTPHSCGPTWSHSQMCRPGLKPTGAHSASRFHRQLMGYRGKEEPDSFWRCWWRRWYSRCCLPAHAKDGTGAKPLMDINTPSEPACRHLPPPCRLHPSDWQRHKRTLPFPTAASNSDQDGESLSLQIPCLPLQALGEAGSLRVVEHLPAAETNRNTST